MRFRLVTLCMTFDDLEVLEVRIFSEFRVISQNLRGNNGKANDDRPVLSAMHRLR